EGNAHARPDRRGDFQPHAHRRVARLQWRAGALGVVFAGRRVLLRPVAVASRRRTGAAAGGPSTAAACAGPRAGPRAGPAGAACSAPAPGGPGTATPAATTTPGTARGRQPPP